MCSWYTNPDYLALESVFLITLHCCLSKGLEWLSIVFVHSFSCSSMHLFTYPLKRLNHRNFLRERSNKLLFFFFSFVAQRETRKVMLLLRTLIWPCLTPPLTYAFVVRDCSYSHPGFNINLSDKNNSIIHYYFILNSESITYLKKNVCSRKEFMRICFLWQMIKV